MQKERPDVCSNPRRDGMHTIDQVEQEGRKVYLGGLLGGIGRGVDNVDEASSLETDGGSLRSCSE